MADAKDIKVSMFVAIAAAVVGIPAIVSYAIFIYGVKVDAHKGAKAYRLMPQIAWDLQQLKQAQKIKDKPIPPEFLDNSDD